MQNRKNILVIGGSYFAGRVFVEKLVRKQGYNVYVYNRGNIPFQWKSITELVGDRQDEARIKEVIPNIEWNAVVDFCGYTPQDIEKMLRSLPGSIHQYIFISTTSLYEKTYAFPIKEDFPKLSKPQPELGPMADYGISKWLAECQLQAECEKRGIAHTSLRPAIIYGRYNYAPRENYFFDLLANNQPVVIPSNPLPLFSFIWVENLAEIILECVGNKKVFNQAFNVSAEELISYPRLVEVLERIKGNKIKIVRMDIQEINQKMIPLPFPLDHHLIYSSAKLQQVLQFKFTPFFYGIKKTYEYYQMVQQRKQQST